MTGTASDLLLLPFGAAAGAIGSVGGLASLVGYPAMLLLGYSPLASNVTNTVAQIGSGVSTTLNYRPELTGQRPVLIRLISIGVIGGLLGAGLLLALPTAAFAHSVPVLIAFAALTVLARRQTQPHPSRPVDRTRSGWFGVSVFLIAVYSGFFGAAAGVLMLALLLVTTADSMARCNATKSVVLTAANAVAAVPLMIFGPVAWTAAVPLSIGYILGGAAGPTISRRCPERLLRMAIAAGGLVLAASLAVRTY
jgi:uncharacterized membrane protein YfcA